MPAGSLSQARQLGGFFPGFEFPRHCPCCGEEGPGGFSLPSSWEGGAQVSLTALFLSPFQFHYDHNRAQFYVEDATAASALKLVSRKITDRENYKVWGQVPQLGLIIAFRGGREAPVLLWGSLSQLEQPWGAAETPVDLLCPRSRW